MVPRFVMGLLLTLVLIVAIGLFSAVWYSYSTLSASFPRVTGISPAITNDVPTLLSAGVDLAKGNLLGAAENLINGVDFDVEVEITNEGVVPVFIGTSDHILVLNGKEVTEPIALKGGWIRPDSTLTIPFKVSVLLTELPGAVVLGIVQGGRIDVQLKSKVGWGFMSKTILTQVVQFQVTETVESIVWRLLPN